jgi:2-oxo-3-hexenedioate decarboxylase
MSDQIEAMADRLAAAVAAATAIGPLTTDPGLDIAAAYQVQAALVGRALARGQRLVGLKLGLTSRAKMEQMGVDEPVWGRLTDAMWLPEGGTVGAGRFIHPRVEPEVAFRLGAGGEPVAVAAALELIDSRYAGFRFTLPDVVADNASAAGFVLGAWRPIPSGLDNLGVLLEVDGRVAETGSTAAILGDPRRALARVLDLAGITPEPGWVVLAGAATAAVPVRPGAYARAVVEGLGGAGLGVTP